MDFFESQDIARRNTGRLIFLFGLAVAVLIIGTYFGVLIGWYAFFSEEIAADPNRSMTLWNGQVFVLSTALTLATVFGGSYFKTRSLSSGGRAVAESLGGRRVDYNTSDADDRRFLNVVEEMALASGVPVPAMYILEDELGINAFAAGFTINDAAVAVTRGCLNNLTRDELQGVVAHEFAHILNGDMRLNIRLIGVLHGILIVFLTGRILLHAMRGGGSRRGSGVAVIAVIGLILVVVGWFGLLAGRLIKSAVSRQREYLADAAAVQFTRNPDGISGALKKIGGLKNGSKIVASNAEELSHLFFGNFKGGRWRGSWTNNFMSTHPPLDERIRRLEPKFAGDYVKAAPIVHQVERGASEKKPSGHAFGAAMPVAAMAMAAGAANQAPVGPPRGAGTSSGSAGPEDVTAQINVNPQEVLSSIGHATAHHLDLSKELLGGLSPELRAAMHEPFGAVALVYTLLLDTDRKERQRQAEILKSSTDTAVLREAMKLWPHVAQLDPRMRLPMVDLVVPALRQLTGDQYAAFKAAIHRLIWADGELVLFEFVIQKVLLHHLEPNFGAADKRQIQFRSLPPLLDDCNVLLSSLARHGHDDEVEAQSSHRAALARLAEVPTQTFPMLSEQDASFERLDTALERLSLATPGVKRHVVEACTYCVLGDGQVTLEEGELLRAVCELLDCPLPPFLG